MNILAIKCFPTNSTDWETSLQDNDLITMDFTYKNPVWNKLDTFVKTAKKNLFGIILTTCGPQYSQQTQIDRETWSDEVTAFYNNFFRDERKDDQKLWHNECSLIFFNRKTLIYRKTQLDNNKQVLLVPENDSNEQTLHFVVSNQQNVVLFQNFFKRTLKDPTPLTFVYAQFQNGIQFGNEIMREKQKQFIQETLQSNNMVENTIFIINCISLSDFFQGIIKRKWKNASSFFDLDALNRTLKERWQKFADIEELPSRFEMKDFTEVTTASPKQHRVFSLDDFTVPFIYDRQFFCFSSLLGSCKPQVDSNQTVYTKRNKGWFWTTPEGLVVTKKEDVNENQQKIQEILYEIAEMRKENDHVNFRVLRKELQDKLREAVPDLLYIDLDEAERLQFLQKFENIQFFLI